MTTITVELGEVVASYTPHAITLLNQMREHPMDGSNGLNELYARHVITWDGVTITTVTTLKVTAKPNTRVLTITFEHGVQERCFNFFSNYPRLRSLLSDQLAEKGWRMRTDWNLDNKGMRVTIVPR